MNLSIPVQLSSIEQQGYTMLAVDYRLFLILPWTSPLTKGTAKLEIIEYSTNLVTMVN